jgi:hypothetical protein
MVTARIRGFAPSNKHLHRRPLQPDAPSSICTSVCPSSFSCTKAAHHDQGIVHKRRLAATRKERNIARRREYQTAALALLQHGTTNTHSNLTIQHWLYSLSFQQVQTRLTLFSKSFSPFPHGTCLLSVLNTYLALDDNYHPLCAPGPRNVTLQTFAVHGALQTSDRILTLRHALFQEAYICNPIGKTFPDYNSRPLALIPMLSSSLFIRHY